MAYIYQIINDINDKIYVGKTEFSIEKRLIHPAEGRKSTVAIRVIPKYRIYEARIKSEEWQRRPTQECLGVKQ